MLPMIHVDHNAMLIIWHSRERNNLQMEDERLLLHETIYTITKKNFFQINKTRISDTTIWEMSKAYMRGLLIKRIAKQKRQPTD